MARGNNIIVSSEPRGKFEEGYVAAGETHYPGMILQKDPAVSLVGGRHTFKIYNRDADGNMPRGAFWIATGRLEQMIGRPVTQSIAAGERTEYYAPLAGDELNLLLENLPGTSDDHALDEILMVNDGTGKLIATTGSPETEVAQLKEAVTDPTADRLVWVDWTGH